MFMKGINPFTPGIQTELTERKQETRLFESYLSSTIAGQPVFMQLTGAKGFGKTLMFRKFQEIAEKNIALAVVIRAHRDKPVAFLNQMIDELRNTLAEKGSFGLLPKKYADIFDRKKTETPIDMREKLRGIHINMRNNISAIVFLVDDSNRLSKEALNGVINTFSGLAAGKIPYMLVLASTGELHIPRDLFRTVRISPLNEREITGFIQKSLEPHKLKMGEECLRSIIGDSQGHPLVLLTICWTIYDKIKENEKVISKGHYLAYLPAIMNNLSRELFDDLYDETSQGERGVLRAFAKSGGEANVSSIAGQISKPLGTVTTLVLRLAKKGNLNKTARGKYIIFNRLYGKYILNR